MWGGILHYAQNIDDSALLSRIHHTLGTLAFNQIRFDNAGFHYERAIALANEANVPERTTATYSAFSQVLQFQMRYAEAEQSIERSIELATKYEHPEIITDSLINRVTVQGMTGRTDHALETLDIVEERLLQFPHVHNEVFVDYLRSLILSLVETRHNVAMELVKIALEKAEKAHLTQMTHECRSLLGAILHNLGDSDKGYVLLQTAIKDARETGNFLTENISLMRLFEMLIERGELDEAQECLQELRDGIDGRGLRGIETYALYLEAQMKLQLGERDVALQNAQRALAAFAEAGHHMTGEVQRFVDKLQAEQ